jgi:hypothetical protein
VNRSELERTSAQENLRITTLSPWEFSQYDRRWRGGEIVNARVVYQFFVASRLLRFTFVPSIVRFERIVKNDNTSIARDDRHGDRNVKTLGFEHGDSD